MKRIRSRISVQKLGRVLNFAAARVALYNYIVLAGKIRMRFTITGRNIKLSRSIGVYTREKLAKLLGRFFKDPRTTDAAAVDIGLSRVTRRHRKGMVWKADAVLAPPNRKRPLYAEATAQDVHSAIDILAEEVEREIQKYKGKFVALARRGARAAKKDLRLDPAARLYRQGRIRDESA